MGGGEAMKRVVRIDWNGRFCMWEEQKKAGRNPWQAVLIFTLGVLLLVYMR